MTGQQTLQRINEMKTIHNQEERIKTWLLDATQNSFKTHCTAMFQFTLLPSSDAQSATSYKRKFTSHKNSRIHTKKNNVINYGVCLFHISLMAPEKKTGNGKEDERETMEISFDCEKSML